MYFDTHAHFDDSRYDGDRDIAIREALDSGVSLITNIGADIKSSFDSVELANKYDEIYATVGAHPYDAEEITDGNLDKLRELAKNNRKVVAIGEIGLDYYRGGDSKKEQIEAFRNQIALARELNLPVVIHSRDATEDTMRIIKEEKVSELGGVMHCFAGSVETAREVIKNNLYISFGGVLTFKNAKTAREVFETIPLEHILVETDCPYLAPEPFRGKRNSSALLKYVIYKMAELSGETAEYIAKTTLENGKKMYRID